MQRGRGLREDEMLRRVSGDLTPGHFNFQSSSYIELIVALKSVDAETAQVPDPGFVLL